MTPTRRSRDPLSAATSSVLLPVVRALGFEKLTARSFARRCQGVLHYFDLQLSAWGSKRFAVNYAAITLYSPRDFMVLQPGGRLPRGKSSDGWWSADTHEHADAAMSEVARRLVDHCEPWFERAETDEGHLELLREEQSRLSRPDAHSAFDVACILAHLNRVEEARQAALSACGIYRDWHLEMPGRTWCLAGMARCDTLVAAIDTRAHEPLIDVWTRHSEESLKLSRLEARGAVRRKDRG